MSQEVDNSAPTTLTSTALLEGLAAPDCPAVWQEFVGRYRPLLVLYACRLGLREDMAEDATQQALMAFCTAYRQGKYQREKGRLRDWLFGIARHQILNAFKRLQKQELQIAQRTGCSDFFAGIPADDQMEPIWQQEWREAVLRQCLKEVEQEFDAKSIQAFELFARDALPAKQVARQLGMTDNAVFLAKRRVLARVRELLPKMEETW